MEDIARDTTNRITEAGFAESLVTHSRAIIAAVSATTSRLVGRPTYYQHLVSARKARNALEGHTNGITTSLVGLALSHVGGSLLILKALFSS